MSRGVIERVAEWCRAEVIAYEKHLRVTALSAPDHRPCESGARAKFAENILEILPDGNRPLVVIDPEDREQVERLARLVWDQPLHLDGEDVFQAALREFADPKPLKPAEPTGLGAVVEDAKGNRWVRFCETSSPAWCSEPYDDEDYADIDVVKVLSDGVTS